MIYPEDRMKLRALGVVSEHEVRSAAPNNRDELIVTYYFDKHNREIAYRFHGNFFELMVVTPGRVWGDHLPQTRFDIEKELKRC